MISKCCHKCWIGLQLLQQTNKHRLAGYVSISCSPTNKKHGNQQTIQKTKNYPPAGHFSIPVLACAPLPASLASPTPPRGAAPPEHVRLFKGGRAKMSKPRQVAKVNVIK